MSADPELTARLRDMLVSVERALERVPLDLLAFPCRSCGLDDTCACSRDLPPHTRVLKKDSAIQTSPMYEMDSSIPHIDSDDEHEHTSCVGRCASLCPANRLSEIPESHLMAGIYLPGLHDLDGRAIAVFDFGSISRVGLSPPECARIILYYSTIPIRCERTERGLCIVAVSAGDRLELLDNCLTLVTEKIGKLIIFGDEEIPSATTSLPVSRIQFTLAKDRQELEKYIAPEQIPLHCAGDTTHDQLQWIEFTKEAECLISQCEDCGRRLIEVMAELGDSSDMNSSETSRRQLHHQNRTIARLLGDTDLHRLRKDAPSALAHLRLRAQWLSNSEDVRLGLEKAEYLFNEVDSVAKTLEELVEKRKEKLRDIARVKALEHETEQVLSWLSNKGDDWLRKHSELATTLPALKQQEQDFERFYFISMRHLDKGGDLVDEAGQCVGSGSSGLRDLARTLKNHLRGFSDRLEDTRERLEDTSRCFYLLDRAYEWALEAMKYMSRVKPEDAQNPETSLKQLRQYLMAHPPLPPEHFTEMLSLATKLDNEKLLQQCKVAQSRCDETLEQVRSLLGTEPVRWGSSSNRRRSLPCQPSSGATNQCCHQPQLQLQDIAEECICRSTNNGNPPLQRSCTWQYSPDSFDEEDKLSADNTTEGSDTGTKSCEDVDEAEACCGKPVTPIPVNSHLHNDLAVEIDAHCGTQTLKTKKTMLLIMREMIQTERDYVRSLEYVIENYIPELVREDIPQALRGQRNVIFGNIEKIYEFHSQYFLQELEKCEQNPLSVGQCFLRHENKFYLYALYNKNKPKSDSLMSEYGSAFFRAKQLELGDKMDLASYLLKPVQRMGKYALLLQQLMKASRQDNSDLRSAETMVRFQLRHGNDLLAMDSLRECDVNVKEQGRLLRQNEFLVWQGKGGKKYYRHVFLFEELILFSKARRFPDRKNLDLYIYKQSIKTSDIGLTAKVGDSNTKFEIWFRKRKPNDTFTLQSISEDIKQAWTNELSNLLWKQALRNREMRLAEMSSMGIGNKPCLDIRPSANQISDRSISIAQLSKTAPRFRNSIAVSPVEHVRKRPHSIISVSSSASSSSGSSSSASSTGSNGSSAGSSSGDHRQHSQCSSTESGIVSDWSPNESVSSDTTQVSVKL